MTFYIRNYSSEERYDISKFLYYENGVYDTSGSPFLAKLKELPTVKYYYVDEGYREVDLIAQQEYGDLFFAYLIQFYNNMFMETFPEGTKLNLFSSDDLEELYHEMAVTQNLSEQ